MNAILPYSLDRLVKAVPGLTAQPISLVSEKYVHVPTVTVVEDIMSLGWIATDYKNCSYSSTGKHTITFQHPDFEVKVGNSQDLVRPRIVLLNSHDRTSAFRFWGGLFRFVCYNGLVISLDENLKHSYISVRHIHYTFDKLKETIELATKGVANQSQNIFTMQNIILTPAQMEEFAKLSFLRRYGVSDLLIPQEMERVSPKVVSTLLTPFRDLDKEDNAWLVANRVHEHILERGFTGVDLGSNQRKTFRRPNHLTNLKLNSHIFSDMQNIIDRSNLILN